MSPGHARRPIRALAAALACALCAACSVDPVKDLKRQAIGMRPRLLETCLPEASEVEIEGDVERLTYAWTLGGSDDRGDELESVGSFQSPAPVPGGACKVIVEIDSGVVRKIELGEPEPGPADVACAQRVRACLAAPKASTAQ
jgi:hypothetical protein